MAVAIDMTYHDSNLILYHCQVYRPKLLTSKLIKMRVAYAMERLAYLMQLTLS
jgi:hypothetical protein